MRIPFYDFLATNPALTLLLGAIFTGIWLWDIIIRNPEEEEETPWYIKVIDYSGFFVGLLILIPTGIIMLVSGDLVHFIYGPIHYDLFTKVLVLLVGLALFFKPLRDAPIATIIGLVGGAIVAFFVIIIVDTPLQVIAYFGGFDIKWIYVIVFFIIFIVVALALKWAATVLQWIGKILGSKPASLVLAVICILQAILISLPVPVPGVLSIGFFFELLIQAIFP
ncbi:MAG: hypothetical protein ACTSSI_05430 [Candidatus Helarchaeota archaeon]